MTGLDKVISVLQHFTEADGDPFDVACDEALSAQLGAEIVSQENLDLRRLLAIRTIPGHELDVNFMVGAGIDFMQDTPTEIGEKLQRVELRKIRQHIKAQARRVIGPIAPVNHDIIGEER